MCKEGVAKESFAQQTPYLIYLLLELLKNLSLQ